MEKWEDRKDLVFLHLCLVGGVEKWRYGKLFYLVEIKNERLKYHYVLTKYINKK